MREVKVSGYTGSARVKERKATRQKEGERKREARKHTPTLLLAIRGIIANQWPSERAKHAHTCRRRGRCCCCCRRISLSLCPPVCRFISASRKGAPVKSLDSRHTNTLCCLHEEPTKAAYLFVQPMLMLDLGSINSLKGAIKP